MTASYSLRSQVSRLAFACGLELSCGLAAAGSLEVQNQNVNTGLFAARVGVVSSCTADLHAFISGPVLAGDYVGCSTLTSDGELASGAATFTAGDLVILRDGFRVSAGASLTVEIDRTLYPDAWVQDDTPDGETVYSARFYVDPAGLNFTDDSQRFFHFLAFDANGSPEFRVGLKRTGTEQRVFFEVFEDNGLLQTTEGFLELVLGPGWHWVDVGWQAGSGEQKGFGFICLDSPAPPLGCVELSDLDNDTGAIDFVRWGAVDVPSNSNLGLLDLDDFSSEPFDDGFESGTTAAWSTSGEGPASICAVPSQYAKIQAAVNAPECSTIDVAPGVYTEVLAVSRTLTIRGPGPGSSVLAGPLSVSGPGTEVSLESFVIDTTGPLTGCYPFALEVRDGAVVYSAAITVSHGAGPPVGPCIIFSDGFEPFP